MLKILYIPTGNIFTMPDEEALKLAQTERYNYKILDAGIQEEKEPEKVSEEDISKIVLQTEERAKEIEAEDNAEEEKEEVQEAEPDLSGFNKKDLVGTLRRLGIKCNDRQPREHLVKLAIEAGIK